MLLDHKTRETLSTFFHRITVQNEDAKTAKIGQILGYLEIIHAQLRQYAPHRPIVCIECGSGHAYLSFLLYYFYTKIEQRPIIIHCVDTNSELIQKAQQRADTFQFDQIHFHTCDIADYTLDQRVDLVYALHACGSATDKTLHLGIRHNTPCILSVACCQHTLVRQLKGHPLTELTKYRVFKENIAYMVGDTLRAFLLEMQNYKADILPFASTKFTDKNIMLRARKTSMTNKPELQNKYTNMRDTFHVTPMLEQYLK